MGRVRYKSVFPGVGESQIRDEFQTRVNQSLSAYKREILGVEEDGIWGTKGRAYSHILPKEKYRLNILASFRGEFWEWFGKRRLQLHRGFHHLNSSQALCFNLFFPMLSSDGEALAPLLSALNIQGLPNNGACFEFQPDPMEGTTIDFSLTLKSQVRINFEIKYSESDFGSAKSDEAHLEKFERVYRPRLSGRFEEPFCFATQFLKHYQIARNVWHLNELTQDVAIFLFPRENTRLKRGEMVIKSCAVERFQPLVRVVYLEDLVLNLLKELKPNKMTGLRHIEEFSAKYFPDVALKS